MESIKKKYPKFAEATVKIFAVLGLVIIIMIAIYGALAALRSIPNVWHAIGNAFSSVTSVFTDDKKLDLEARPQTAISGENVVISIDGRKISDGNFFFTYDCVDGVNFELLSPSTGNKGFAFCNVPTEIEVQGGNVTLIPSLINKEIVKVPITIEYKEQDTDSISASGSLSLTVLRTAGGDANDNEEPDRGDDRPATSTPTTPERPKTPNVPSDPNGVLIPGNTYPVLYGNSDLTVRVLDTGTVNRTSGLYSPSTTIRSTDLVGVRFEVINVGTNLTGSWRFNAVLPTGSAYLYASLPQQSLNPGDRIQYVIAFEGIKKQQVNQIVITADPENTVRESNERNNDLIQSLYLSDYRNDDSEDNYRIPLSSDCDRNSSGEYTCYRGDYRYTGCEIEDGRWSCDRRRSY